MNDIQPFIPEPSYNYVKELIDICGSDIRVVNKRTTKFGDFRPGSKKRKSVITINKDLNPYAFLITLVHEIAHAYVHIFVRKRIRPHGAEWKKSFKELMHPLQTTSIFPEDLLVELDRHMINPRATTISDSNLFKSLRKYDENSSSLFLEDLDEGETFLLLNGRRFIKMEKRRKNYFCLEVPGKRKYLINAMAEVMRD